MKQGGFIVQLGHFSGQEDWFGRECGFLKNKVVSQEGQVIWLPFKLLVVPLTTPLKKKRKKKKEKKIPQNNANQVIQSFKPKLFMLFCQINQPQQNLLSVIAQLPVKKKKPVNPHYSKSFPKYPEARQAGEKEEEARPLLKG